jgi:high-affinity K+ transport system ATPase subunit B
LVSWTATQQAGNKHQHHIDRQQVEQAANSITTRTITKLNKQATSWHLHFSSSLTSTSTEAPNDILAEFAKYLYAVVVVVVGLLTVVEASKRMTTTEKQQAAQAARSRRSKPTSKHTISSTSSKKQRSQALSREQEQEVEKKKISFNSAAGEEVLLSVSGTSRL